MSRNVSEIVLCPGGVVDILLYPRVLIVANGCHVQGIYFDFWGFFSPSSSHYIVFPKSLSNNYPDLATWVDCSNIASSAYHANVFLNILNFQSV